METEDFARFVASQQETDADARVNWAGTRDEWLKDLDSFHEKIVDFLKEYIDGGSIAYQFAEIELTEPNIGKYLAKRMDIKIGRQQVWLIPIGTLIVACKGRVDAVGSAGRAQIFLIDERTSSASDLIKVTVNIEGRVLSPASPQKPPISWVWKILTNAPNALQRRFVDLDKTSFSELLLEITNA
jgi:hypothetical protein